MCNFCNTNGFGRGVGGCSTYNTCGGCYHRCGGCCGGWCGNGWAVQRVCRDACGNIRVMDGTGCGYGCTRGCTAMTTGQTTSATGTCGATYSGCLNLLTVTDDAYYAQLYGLNGRCGSTRCGCCCANAYTNSTAYTDTVNTTDA